MSLKGILNDNWFRRMALVTSIICAGLIFVLFKNLELIVHGRLYYYGLELSPHWADPYRLYTWLIYISLGLPTAFSCIALVSSFLNVGKVKKKQNTVQQRTGAPQETVKIEPRPAVRKVPERFQNSNGDNSSCPRCKKIFSRPLVMLDFRSGKNRVVNVCPYCNYVLGYTSEERVVNEEVM